MAKKGFKHKSNKVNFVELKCPICKKPIKLTQKELMQYKTNNHYGNIAHLECVQNLNVL